jgi:hypothetical protein
MNVPAKAERANSLFFCLFVLFHSSGSSVHWIESTHLGKSSVPFSVYKLKCTDIPRDILPVIWTSVSPVKLTHKISHLRGIYISRKRREWFLKIRK